MISATIQDLPKSLMLSVGLPDVHEMQFGLHAENSLQRQQLEACIAKKYLCVHQATSLKFLPVLLSMTNTHETLAAVGLNPGSCGPMFLEQYLNNPIEQSIASFARQPIDRHTLIEIGNLAVIRKGTGLLMFVVMSMALAACGYQWMVFTATPEVTKLIRRLGFDPQYIAEADSTRIISGKKHWGSYYEKNPKVMAGSLGKASRIAENNVALSKVRTEYQEEINSLSKSLAHFRQFNSMVQA